MSDKIIMARLALKVIASLGVSKVIGDIVTNNVSTVTKMDVVKVWVGSIVLGTMIADYTGKYVEEQFNNVLVWIETQKAEDETI